MLKAWFLQLYIQTVDLGAPSNYVYKKGENNKFVKWSSQNFSQDKAVKLKRANKLAIIYSQLDTCQMRLYCGLKFEPDITWFDEMFYW